MPRQQPDYEAPLAYEIELGLQRIAGAPDDLSLHEQLRVTSLRYKAEGGRAAGALEQFRLPHRDPIQRLLHLERLWALDPGNFIWPHKMLAALAAAERADPLRNFAPVRRWLYRILEDMAGA